VDGTDGTIALDENHDEQRPHDRRPGRLTLPALAVLLVVAAAIATTAYRTVAEDDSPEVVRRADHTADLLGWLPANDANRRSFAVWVGEGAAGMTPPALMDVPLQGELGLAPYPRTLGQSGDWRQTYGWGAGDVSAWAVAGEAEDIAVLAGDFDLSAVGDALETAGYERSSYRGADVYVLHPVATPAPVVAGDATSAANAVAILAGRLITAASEAGVRAAIDAATGKAPSLADDPPVAALLRAAGPNAGLAALDAADLAAVCAASDPTARATGNAPSGQYAALAYGFATEGAARQTVVVVTMGDETAAQTAAPAWNLGWQDAVVALGDVSGPAAGYGTLTSTGAAGNAVIARFADGRAEGWAPLALRLASPVCLAVGALAPVAEAEVAPPPTATQRRAIALAALPDAAGADTFVFADLAATSAARGVVAPVTASGIAPATGDVADWWSALGPLPGLTVLPSDPAILAQIPVDFGIGLDQLDLVAEVRIADPARTVGLFVGRWSPDAVERALVAAGYESIRLGEVVVFAHPSPSSQPAGVPAAWANVALLGDRLWLSPSSGILRDEVERASEPTTGAASLRANLLLAGPEATSGFVVGGEAARLDCAARGVTGQTPAWDGLAALWTATAAGDRAAIVLRPAEGIQSTALASELEDELLHVRVVLSSPDATTPIPGRPLGEVAGYSGSRIADSAAGSVLVVADFAIPSPRLEAAAFFATVDGGCVFATLA
jgi:hypothetical protein